MSQEKATADLKMVLSSDYANLEQVVDFAEAFFRSNNYTNDLQDRMLVALSEAATNAMRHGNKLDPNKHVTIELFQGDKELRILVRDEGQGFDRSSVESPLLPENLLKTSGRGLFLIEELADETYIESGGTCLRMVFRERASNDRAR